LRRPERAAAYHARARTLQAKLSGLADSIEENLSAVTLVLHITQKSKTTDKERAPLPLA